MAPGAPSPVNGDALKRFLVDHSDDLSLPAAEGLAPLDRSTTSLGTVARYQQSLHGRLVLGTHILVATNAARDRVVRIELDREPTLQPSAPAGGPSLTAEEASQAAREAVGDPELRSDPPPPTRAYLPRDDGLREVLVVLLATQDPMHDWRVVVDAATGEVLERRDLIRRVDGSGLVFDPNPVVTAADDTLRVLCNGAGTPRAMIDLQRVRRPLRGIRRNPATGKYQLVGPFVEIRRLKTSDAVLPGKVDPHDFAYSSSDAQFGAVNAYQAVDAFQRYLQDPMQGPPVTDARNKPIICDPHSRLTTGSCYSSHDKALYFGGSGPCAPARSEDAHAVLHEYGHAIQDDQVPGWGETSPETGREETCAMGEGYADALACIYFAVDHGFRPAVFEPWAGIDQGGLRRVDGTRTYPDDWVGPDHRNADGNVDAEYVNGGIWSAAVWNAYRVIGGASAVQAERAAARDAVIKTVTLSHRLVLPSGTMPDGAEAVLQRHAEIPDYRGRHLAAFLDSFHAHGILPSDPAADLRIGDGTATETSADVWIRRGDDDGTTHEAPAVGQDNQLRALVRNAGTAAARVFVVTFAIRPVAGPAKYPADFLPPLSAACGFALAPGAEVVVRAPLPAALVPPPGTPTRLLASVYRSGDGAADATHVGGDDHLAQRLL